MKLTEYIVITLNEKTCLSVCRRRQCSTERCDLLGTERGDLLSKETRKHRLGLCSTNKKSKSSPNVRQKLRNTNSRLITTEKSIQKLNETIESQKEEICRAHQGDERRRQDQQLLHEQLLQQYSELREAHQKSLTEMEELKKFQSSTFDTIARLRLVEDQDTIFELSCRIQELQNEINCMSDAKEFQDAELIRNGNSNVTSRPVSFPPHPIPQGMLSRSFGVPSRRRRAAKHLGHTWKIGKRFCKSRCVIISTLSSRIASMEFINRRAAPFVHSGKE